MVGNFFHEKLLYLKFQKRVHFRILNSVNFKQMDICLRSKVKVQGSGHVMLATIFVSTNQHSVSSMVLATIFVSTNQHSVINVVRLKVNIV